MVKDGAGYASRCELLSGVRGWGKRKLQNNDMEEKVLEAFVPDCQWGSPKANGLLQQDFILFYFMITFFKNPGEINHNTKLASAVQYLPWVALLNSSFNISITAKEH